MRWNFGNCLIGIVAIALLNACTNKLSRDDSPIAQMTPAQWKQPTLPDSVRALSWNVFDDSELGILISTGLAGSLSIEMARQRIEAAHILLAGERAVTVPAITLSESYNRSGGKRSANTTSWATSVGAAFEVDFWGRIDRRIQQRALDLSIAEIDFQTARITLASQIAEAYFSLWSIDRQIQLQQESLEKTIKTRHLVNERFKGGLAIAVDVDRQDVLVADLEANIINLKSSRALFENSLAVLLGVLPQTFDYQVNHSELSKLIQLAPETPAEILRNRPDIKSAEMLLAKSHIDVDLVRTRIYPTLNLTAAANFTSSSLDDLFNTAMAPWQVVADGTQPLFDGGARQAELDQAYLNHRQILTRYQETILIALQDIESALALQASIARQQQSIQRQKIAQRRISEQSALKYLQGEITALELLIDENALIDIERQEVDTWLNGMLASISLLRALGVDPQG